MRKIYNVKEAKEQLIKNIINNPNNISAAIRLTARQVQKTNDTVRSWYYSSYKNKDGVERGIKFNKALFITQTPEGILINTKNTGVAKESTLKMNLKTELNNLSDFTTEQKVSLIDILFTKK